ncbi:3-methyl-2-oxobutanoate hydroxymethyltransferase NDAI_0C05760 [Naumovozyma dairenensis CBS 421]|uniref:3-methyl-2-oxobutanoate hydroxymethyltransferase n=1 Tax=Naumovozyma dairenensis (strain ATCC 10597 / BCRC 20456 / CBS 421 / NBRC 0211 / NRRL Y-12639) TaxID=1071378 RepID=G0W8X4_NAUDC|nr:hypothetical protein NDAI_0C05760 [Naumovozyma dairenensis CBS 421]CCD24235.1 hypothetical protein NDAI_0C05760 [Naumovozyma dairenensis CBS 421]
MYPIIKRSLFRIPTLARLYSAQPLKKKATTTILDIQSKRSKDIPITMTTAYDSITASWCHEAQSDMILVGDSLAMTSLGYASTTDLPFDEFKYHVKSVCRVPGPSLIVVDMPFGSFESSIPFGISNAIELMKLDSNVTSLKVEVGLHTKDKYTPKLIGELCARGIPVMGHIGLTPQRAHSLGGFKVQGNKSVEETRELLETAKLLQDLGCWSILMECVPHKVATLITSKLDVPTIGIGAGNGTNGQVLVISDMLGMQGKSVPKFVKKYSNLNEIAINGIANYTKEVMEKSFPETASHTFKIKDELWEEIEKNVA